MSRPGKGWTERLGRRTAQSPRRCRVSPQSFARTLAEARTFAAQAGRPAGSLTGALFIWGSVDDDAERARREAVAFVRRVYHQAFGPLADRYLLHGDPDAVVARLAESISRPSAASSGGSSAGMTIAARPARRSAARPTSGTGATAARSSRGLGVRPVRWH